MGNLYNFIGFYYIELQVIWKGNMSLRCSLVVVVQRFLRRCRPSGAGVVEWIVHEIFNRKGGGCDLEYYEPLNGGIVSAVFGLNYRIIGGICRWAAAYWLLLSAC
jgi:hypothetical protein